MSQCPALRLQAVYPDYFTLIVFMYTAYNGYSGFNHVYNHVYTTACYVILLMNCSLPNVPAACTEWLVLNTIQYSTKYLLQYSCRLVFTSICLYLNLKGTYMCT